MAKKKKTVARKKLRKKHGNIHKRGGLWGKTLVERKRLQVVYEEVDIDVLHEWKENPRVNADAIPRVAELIKEHGFAGVIVATPDGTIRAGHTRWAAAKSLGMVTIWVHWKNFASLNAADAYAMADNKSGEWADWDHAKLSKLFANRNKADLAVLKSASGFRASEIDWQGPTPLPASEIEDIDEEEESFVLRVDKLTKAHADLLCSLVTDTMQDLGYPYEARVY